MKSRPIIFSGDMVRAILEGRKTQTRRLIKRDYMERPEEPYPFYIRGKYALWNSFKTIDELVDRFSPHGKSGDTLWVKETQWLNGGYVASDPENFPNEGKKPSIFCRKVESRILLEIEEVKVESLQDIDKKGAVAEGIRWSEAFPEGYTASPPHDYSTNAYAAELSFRKLWEKIHGIGSWNENPFVWVIQFNIQKQGPGAAL